MKKILCGLLILSGCGVGVEAADEEGASSSSLSVNREDKPLPVPPIQVCSEDKECGVGAWCDTPCAPPKACASAGVCRPLPSQCRADADCPERFYCDDPCPAPRVCAQAPSCKPVPPPTKCSEDSACASGYHCALPCGPDGDCVPLGICERNP
ncbi:MAG: hypothetical protein Q8L48_23605 [Archangium sp.]|nr:hypothetical protein [Archangium sp.]